MFLQSEYTGEKGLLLNGNIVRDGMRKKRYSLSCGIVGCLSCLFFAAGVLKTSAKEQNMIEQLAYANTQSFLYGLEHHVPEIVEITISATGDVTLGVTQYTEYEGSFTQEYALHGEAFFFDNVREYFELDDMTIVNLECSLTTSNDKQEKQWNLKGKPEYVGILIDGCVDAVSMGNNHNRDYGESGLQETISLVEDAGIAYAYDDVVGIYETKGIKIGFVSVNEHYDGVLVETFLQNGIKELEEQNVNMIIACCHWGVEATKKLDDYQVELGYKCIDWGADLVIGNHPHVLQALNVYQNKMIIYSLGNFCFGGNRNPKDKDSAIYQQTFTFVDGVLQNNINAWIIPCKISSVSDRNNYQPTPQEGKQAERIIKKISGYSEPFGITIDTEGMIIIETEAEDIEEEIEESD